MRIYNQNRSRKLTGNQLLNDNEYEEYSSLTHISSWLALEALSRSSGSDVDVSAFVSVSLSVNPLPRVVLFARPSFADRLSCVTSVMPALFALILSFRDGAPYICICVFVF